MKYVIIIIVIFSIVFAICSNCYNRAQWAKVYQKLQYTYWGGLSYYGEVAELDWHYGKLILDCDVVIHPDQFSGNTYVINAEGDTIFKYIKKEKE